MNAPQQQERNPLDDGNVWYRCSQHKVVFQAMHYKALRFATGRNVTHGFSRKCDGWFIGDDADLVAFQEHMKLSYGGVLPVEVPR